MPSRIPDGCMGFLNLPLKHKYSPLDPNSAPGAQAKPLAWVPRFVQPRHRQATTVVSLTEWVCTEAFCGVGDGEDSLCRIYRVKPQDPLLMKVARLGHSRLLQRVHSMCTWIITVYTQGIQAIRIFRTGKFP